MESALFNTYSRFETKFDRGEGVWLIAEDGTRYLDFAAGVAVNSLGHSHPHLVEALKTQAEKLWHISNIYEIPGQETLARRLTDCTFAERVFFTNSGAEALECAIKTARRFHFANGQPERVDIITFEGAFHGRTLATIAAGGAEKYLEGFGPKAQGFKQVNIDNEDDLINAIDENTAGILLEPIQGESGVQPISKAKLKSIRQICDEAGILLLLDEVQTGVGRTGKLFAHEWAEVEPDIMAIAKGIGGGFPLGACLATDYVAAGMVLGTHGSTYGGNPLAMAVGNAVLDVITKDGFLENINEVSLVLKQGLAQIQDNYPEVIEAIRGEGLMIGLKCKILNVDFLKAIREEKMLAVPAGDNVLRLLPPLTLTVEEAREGLRRIEVAAAKCSAK